LIPEHHLESLDRFGTTSFRVLIVRSDGQRAQTSKSLRISDLRENAKWRVVKTAPESKGFLRGGCADLRSSKKPLASSRDHDLFSIATEEILRMRE
jgi:hypothetical protein